VITMRKKSRPLIVLLAAMGVAALPLSS